MNNFNFIVQICKGRESMKNYTIHWNIHELKKMWSLCSKSLVTGNDLKANAYSEIVNSYDKVEDDIISKTLKTYISCDPLIKEIIKKINLEVSFITVVIDIEDDLRSHAFAFDHEIIEDVENDQNTILPYDAVEDENLPESETGYILAEYMDFFFMLVRLSKFIGEEHGIILTNSELNLYACGEKYDNKWVAEALGALIVAKYISVEYKSTINGKLLRRITIRNPRRYDVINVLDELIQKEESEIQ
jgi:hypothetical protein